MNGPAPPCAHDQYTSSSDSATDDAPRPQPERLPYTPEDRKLIYLASPYSDPTAECRQTRYDQVCLAANWLMRDGWHVYSPIAHSHSVAEACTLPEGWPFWQGPSFAMLDRCDVFALLQLNGWQQSIGIREEIGRATDRNMPIEFLSWPDLHPTAGILATRT